MLGSQLGTAANVYDYLNQIAHVWTKGTDSLEDGVPREK
jgi:hypothetical protein